MSEIIFATSFDDKYTPINILSNNNEDFWTTTGLYPQEVFIKLDQPKMLSTMNIVCYNIKKIIVETCENDSAVTYVRQAEQSEIPVKENKLQDFTLNFNAAKQAKIIKITICDGYDEFSCINSVSFK
jgi:hypothetical protein